MLAGIDPWRGAGGGGGGGLTHKLKSILAQLLCEQQRTQHSKPHTPTQHLLHLLNVHDTKHKDELVEDKVPEFVPHVLFLHPLESSEHH